MSQRPHRSPFPLAAAAAVLVALAAPAAAQLLPGLVRGPYLQSPTPTSIVVRWRTAIPSDGRVRYGVAPGELDRVAISAGVGLDHEVRLAGLEPGRRYFYAVGSSLGDVSSGADHTFVTPPWPGTRTPVRIWTFGDSGLGALGRADEVRDAYLDFTGERGTDVWALLGDNAYLEASDPEYQVHFFDYFQGVLRQVPAWSTFGNHEAETASSADESGPYYEIFTFPRDGEAGGEPSGREAFYSFDYANIHFINLNSDDVDRSPDGEMAAWLRRDLDANVQEWTIAFFHHPVYSFGTHKSDTEVELREMRENLAPILEAGGVDLVLAGHSHNYERSVLLDGHYGTSGTLTDDMKFDPGNGRPDEDGAYRKQGDVFADGHAGTVYAVVGTGSEAARFTAIHPAMAATAEVPGSLVIDVDGSRLDARFVDLDGEVQDHFTILRGDFNFPPIARDDTAATAPLRAVAIDVLANDFDRDHDLLLVEGVGAPARGTAVVDPAGTVTYTPAADFAAGSDGFTYTIGDGHGHTATATVTVTVACPPVAGGVFFDDLEPAAEAGWTTETASDESPAGATWTVVEDAGAKSPLRSWFSESSVLTSNKDDRLVSPPLDLTAGSRLTFWHRFYFEAGFDGGVLEISDDGGASWDDLGPWMTAGGYGPLVTIDGRRRAAWSGDSGGGMTRVEVDLGAFAGGGRLVRWRLVADLFTPEATEGWYVDDVEFTELVTGPGRCNLPPVAADDEATTAAGVEVVVDVLANDSDPNGDPLAVADVGTPSHGTAAIEPDGRVRYTPEAGFTGVDSFTYEVSDGELSAAATVTVTVIAEPPVPSRVRGNGEIDDGAGAARFALHAGVEGERASGWIRYRTLDEGGAIDLQGWVGTIHFTAPGSAELAGVCWLGDGSPCTFEATAEDNGHPGAGTDRFGIAIEDATGATVYAAEGVVARGQVKID